MGKMCLNPARGYNASILKQLLTTCAQSGSIWNVVGAVAQSVVALGFVHGVSPPTRIKNLQRLL
jgi:hypothetical protein